MPNQSSLTEFPYPKWLSPPHHSHLHVLAARLDDFQQRLQSQLDGAPFRCNLLLGEVLLKELADSFGTATDRICLHIEYATKMHAVHQKEQFE